MVNKVNVKLILELREKGLSRSEIAFSRHISRRHVNEIFKICSEKALSFAEIANKSADEIYQLFYPHKYAYLKDDFYVKPDYKVVHAELKRVGVTLRLLWLEYCDKARADGAIPFKYTKFCTGYHDYISKSELCSHLSHKPGERCEVDWAGSTMHFTDAQGKVHKAYLFIGILTYSQYCYVQACSDMKSESWLDCHIKMLEFFNGAPLRIVCDNLKTGVIKHPHIGEIVLQEDYERLAEHYHTAIIPARVKKPRDKASAEASVAHCCNYVIAKLRDKRFTSLVEINQAIRVKVNEFNQAPFTKRPGSRLSAYQEELKSLLPLPTFRFELCLWRHHVKVGTNGHISYQKNFYSCPYQYIGQEVSVCDSSNLNQLKIYSSDIVLACHSKFPANVTNRFSTHQEDLAPQNRHSEFDKTRIENWAARIGISTAAVIAKIFSQVKYEQQGYNSCLAILRLTTRYGHGMVERACTLALEKVSIPRYRHIAAILEEQKDGENDKIKTATAATGFLRGADYYRNLKLKGE